MKAFKQRRDYSPVTTNRTAKQVAKLAFLAYQKAVIDGDPELAEAARVRFLNASAAMSQSRRRAHHAG